MEESIKHLLTALGGAVATFLIGVITYVSKWLISKIKKWEKKWDDKWEPRLKKIDDTHHILRENGIQVICKHEKTCYNKRRETKK